MEESQLVKFVCDDSRHLICIPYTVENLHKMASVLNIKRCWFHNHPTHPHYDIPKRRIQEIQARCEVVSPFELLRLIKESK